MARLVGKDAKLIIGDTESHVDFIDVTIEPEKAAGQAFPNLAFEVTIDFKNAKQVLEVENGSKIAIPAFGEFAAGSNN